MSTLDDKILGEKLHYYCSSSEEEDNTEDMKDLDQNEDSLNSNVREETSEETSLDLKWKGYSNNTGPKGVIKDWQRFKQMERQKREENERQELLQIKKLSISCRSHSDQRSDDSQDSDDSNDDFLKEYWIKRMQEMAEQIDSSAKDRPDFGKLIHLENDLKLLEAIDSEQKFVTIVCHIYTNGVNHCQHMNQCLSSLAKEYPKVKFCAIEASIAGMSKHFSKNGVPALLIYKNGNLLANFVRLSDEFPESFYAEDIEKFLIDHGILNPNSKTIRSSIRESSVVSEDLSD